MTTTTKKRIVRPNLGGSLRPRAEAPRRHFLYLDVTKEEQKQIHEYCKQKKISVSQFFADIVIKDAKSKPKSKDKITIRAEFEVTPEEQENWNCFSDCARKLRLASSLANSYVPTLKSRDCTRQWKRRLFAIICRKKNTRSSLSTWQARELRRETMEPCLRLRRLRNSARKGNSRPRLRTAMAAFVQHGLIPEVLSLAVSSC
jgi:hypothetical protein